MTVYSEKHTEQKQVGKCAEKNVAILNVKVGTTCGNQCAVPITVGILPKPGQLLYTSL
jgi:hypothetical protein